MMDEYGYINIYILSAIILITNAIKLMNTIDEFIYTFYQEYYSW